MTVSNIFSKATRPIVTKFHTEPPWAEGSKVCSNSPGHMTNMVAMPVYGENLETSSLLKPVGHWVLEQ